MPCILLRCVVKKDSFSDLLTKWHFSMEYPQETRCLTAMHTDFSSFLSGVFPVEVLGILAEMKRPTRVLFVYYYFPPRGGVAVQRILKFCKYLQEFNCQVAVLTSGADYTSFRDESLLDEVPLATEVFKTVGQKAIEGQFGRMHHIIDRFLPWVWPAFCQARDIIRKKRIDVVITTSPPHSQQLIGYMLKKTSGVRWIADFRDPWTSDQRFIQHKNGFSLYLERRMEKMVLAGADRVVATTPGAIRAFNLKVSKTPDPEKFVWLPNGYDLDDYRQDVRPPSNRLLFTYIGSTGPEISNPEYFLRAVRKAIDRSPELAAYVQVRFVGSIEQRIKNCIKDLGIESVCEIIANVPHRQAIAYLLESHILLLFELPVVAGRPTLVIPSKVFEYMGASRTIMAMVAEGDTADLLRTYQMGDIVDPLDIDAMSRWIEKYVREFFNGVLPQSVSPPHEFDRRLQTEKLAGVIHSLRS